LIESGLLFVYLEKTWPSSFWRFAAMLLPVPVTGTPSMASIEPGARFMPPR
jgi:hypothetical protein